MSHTDQPLPPAKWTAPRLAALKGRERFAVCTAHDCASARAVDQAGLPVVLVGDSLAMTVLGHANTLPVTLEEMLHHTRAAARGIQSALLVADLPFLSYHGTVEQTLLNAGRFLKEAGADAVKIEGGGERADLVRALTQAGIPVMGHVGLLPQHVKEYGGFRVQGRAEPQAARIVEDARAIAAAGAFSLVVEGVPSPVGAAVTAAVPVPTIGIGAGPDCDAQVLVFHDLLGWQEAFRPRFARRYAQQAAEARAALARFAQDVREGHFPSPDESY
jgi:3-methyl-2-oxobutanoate hydroxymethyltransferase